MKQLPAPTLALTLWLQPQALLRPCQLLPVSMVIAMTYTAWPSACEQLRGLSREVQALVPTHGAEGPEQKL